MASIFDMDPEGMPPRPPEILDTPKRSKTRESLSNFEVTQGKRRLADMVEEAFKVLQEAMVHADYATGIKAAQIILDRAGFGPKSTVDVNSVHVDLSNLTREELAARAEKISGMLRGQKVIDVTPTTIQ
jgi:hypothetical protein